MAEWKPIATAPADLELELGIYDKGEYHALVFPCRRDGLGWRDVQANLPLLLDPTHWRPWKKEQPKSAIGVSGTSLLGKSKNGVQ